jgi:hypothetical protein
MANSDIKQHVSIEERNKWDKVVADFANHLGAGGVSNHRLGNGTVPGFSTNDYTNTEKTKLAGIQDGALNNPHPATHPYTMITGLSTVAHTGSYPDLLNIPDAFKAYCGNCDTVGGIRITISSSSPSNPTNDKEIWFNTSDRLIYIYNGAWIPMRAVFA